MGSDFRAWAEIDLDAIRRNLARLRQLARGARVWPVLKANAYGHGACQVARLCASEGVERIGVGDSREALDLRESGIQMPLLVLGTCIDAEVPRLLVHGIEVGVHSESRVRMLGAAAQAAGRKLGVHLNVDTGMARLGVRPDAALRVARAILNEPALELRGLMTHFAAPEGTANAFTAHQQALFLSAVDELRANQIPVPAVHCANSAALLTGLRPLEDAVRPGIALFGAAPESIDPEGEYEPALSLRAQIVFLKDIGAGTPVGYGGRWTAHRPTRLATLPIGYSDGVPYRLGAEGRGSVLLRGERCPIVGAVSMDYLTIDVGHVRGAQVGDVATLIGRDGGRHLRVQEMASAVGTIPYEITCSLGPRVRRVFRDAQLGSQEPLAIR